jgi:hypothetical protein
VSAQLLIFFKTEGTYQKHQSLDTARHVVLGLCYSAFLFNCSAALTSILLTDILGELPLRSSRIERLQIEAKDPDFVEIQTATLLLERYQAGKTWCWMMWHCESAMRRSGISARLADPSWSGRVHMPLARNFVYRTSSFVVYLAGRSIGEQDTHDYSRCFCSYPDDFIRSPSLMPHRCVPNLVPSCTLKFNVHCCKHSLYLQFCAPTSRLRTTASMLNWFNDINIFYLICVELRYIE